MAAGKDQVTVIVPTFNEEKAIGLVLDELYQEGYSDILVVDNYSTDATIKIVNSKEVKVIQQHGRGKTGALKTAIEHVKTPYMLVMDGDYTYNPMDIWKFLVHIENFDEIIGVRKNGAENIPRLNRLGNKVITKMFNLLMGANLSDVCSGMYMLKTEAARQMSLESGGFETEVEIASQMVTQGKVTEVPINYRKRRGIQKLSRIKDGFRIATSILKLARAYNPALLFSTLAATAFIPGIIILAWVAFRVIFYGTWHSGYALFGTMLLLFGSQGLAVATISVLLKRMEQRIKRRLSVHE